MKTSERSDSKLKPRYPRLELLRRRREIDEFFLDDPMDEISFRHR